MVLKENNIPTTPLTEIKLMKLTKTLRMFSIVAALLGSTAAATKAQGAPAQLPPCGSNPNVNTIMLQDAITQAPNGSTLVLPPGECVVTTCEIARGQTCYGAAGRHWSALHIGNKSNLALVGAPNGTSVLKLHSTPPPRADGYHGYCGPTHVLSIQLSRFITLRDFTIDGSDDELPHDNEQCPPNPNLGAHSGEINEHLHGVRVLNAADITLDHMQLTNAHGDGLNLMAERNQPSLPFTERITVTNNDFLDNDRSGIAFQRNVGFVTIMDNYFRNSGNDQDLDMEPSGGAEELGPYEVDISNNLFERLQPQITVTLGSAGGVQPSRGVRFTYNTIRPSALAAPSTGEGGCILVYNADRTTIAHNTVIGARGCFTVHAQRVTNLVIEENHLESYANLQNQIGGFLPTAVIDVRERVVNRGDSQICGAAPKPPCPYFIYYPDGITVTRNTLVQHVQSALGIRVSNADSLEVTDNVIWSANQITPSGPVSPATRATGIDAPFGVGNLPSYGYYENERTRFKGWSITGNSVLNFADGLRMAPIKAKVFLSDAAVDGNWFNTNLSSPRGIYLQGVASAPQSGFIDSLMVNSNRFGCGFPSPVTVPQVPILPPHAFVRPSGQTFTGNIGAPIPCEETE